MRQFGMRTLYPGHAKLPNLPPFLASALPPLIPVLLASFLGAAVGAEREWRRHPGGLRSSALVCGAASVFAMLALRFGQSNPAAGFGTIASGIGFLGAGVILRQDGQVRGLATAATFWALAAIGTACGLHAYPEAACLTLLVFFAHVALRPLSAWIESRAPPETPGPR